jgi:5-methylcytosine-specific restriction endonuclease McrA
MSACREFPPEASTREDCMRISKNTFPTWSPHRATIARINSLDPKIRIKALRNSSSGFIKKKSVRDFIFERDGNRCVLCGSGNDLQVDHISSVYLAAKDKYLVDLLNKPSNLRTLCKGCNVSLQPNEVVMA